MTKQEFYRAKYAQLKPGWKESIQIYRDLICTEVEGKIVLDIGCGHGDLLEECFKKAKDTYGVDPDPKAIERNTFIKHLAVADAEKLPFEDNFFDVVTMAWVVEHLVNPGKVFSEVNRVLKPNGMFFTLTPNALNYNVWIIRLIPDFLHDFLTRKLYGRQENDTFHVKYKANTPDKINSILEKAGFMKEKLTLNGDPSYISFNDLLFKIALGLENIMDYMKYLRVHLIIQYKKL